MISLLSAYNLNPNLLSKSISPLLSSYSIPNNVKLNNETPLNINRNQFTKNKISSSQIILEYTKVVPQTNLVCRALIVHQNAQITTAIQAVEVPFDKRNTLIVEFPE